MGRFSVKEYNKFRIMLINEAAAALAKSGKFGALKPPFQASSLYTHFFHVGNFSCCGPRIFNDVFPLDRRDSLFDYLGEKYDF